MITAIKTRIVTCKYEESLQFCTEILGLRIVDPNGVPVIVFEGDV
jgi:hypothetical protein